MAYNSINIDEFLGLSKKHPILDVRSPSEFQHAHIPGSFSFPLFDDDERKIVGTIYKQVNKELAIKKGLEFFGPKMHKMIESAEQIQNSFYNIHTATNNIPRRFLVHCWRGGMRSAAISWLLDLYGYKVDTLIGGYKSYRSIVRHKFNERIKFKLIGGYTGSGKTDLLNIMKQLKKPVIDLEELAGHKGSAFGAIGLPAQPSQEMFENKIFDNIYSKQAQNNETNNHDYEIFIEDESQRIGTVNIPQELWENMRIQPMYFLEIPFEKRLQYILETYGKLDRSALIASISRIQKRLGGLETKNAILALLENDTRKSFEILLRYYDKQYDKALLKRNIYAGQIKYVKREDIFSKKDQGEIISIFK